MNVSDIEQYLQRIGVTEPVPANLEGLSTLQGAHLRSVPFENLDIVRGVPVVVDPQANFDKIVRRGRGGYCYELNSLSAIC